VQERTGEVETAAGVEGDTTTEILRGADKVDGSWERVKVPHPPEIPPHGCNPPPFKTNDTMVGTLLLHSSVRLSPCDGGTGRLNTNVAERNG